MRQCDVYRRKKIPEGFVKEFLYDGKRYVEARYITWHIESYKSKNMTDCTSCDVPNVNITSAIVKKSSRIFYNSRSRVDAWYITWRIDSYV